MKKNPVARPHSYHNEIYVTRKRPLKAYINRLQALVEENVDPIIIHATGMAIPQAMDLYLAYADYFPSSAIESSTVTVIDTFDDDSNKLRLLPALHIQLSKAVSS